MKDFKLELLKNLFNISSQSNTDVLKPFELITFE